jgi:hypothetical protein
MTSTKRSEHAGDLLYEAEIQALKEENERLKAEILRLRAHIEILMEKKARKLGTYAVEDDDGEEAENSGMLREEDVETSIAAAKTVEKDLTELQDQVYAILAEHPHGLIDSDLLIFCERAYGERAESTWRKRRKELCRMGCVAYTGTRGINGKGNSERIWAVTGPLPKTRILLASRGKKRLDEDY